MDQTDVAESLKSIRRKKGVTQKMLADELGVALAIYKAYEQGKSNLPYQVYLRLQKVYGPFEDNLWEVEVNERKL
ncbi:MAG: helix-turn-helix transcriptional regulator [Lachnospiraceae bacterium]|jgi:Predicted transcription factor, homolog of eukaryotic MBF1|nr:helix-turn-helix transcriptional regulator [Lachnospiraceae bacterium]